MSEHPTNGKHRRETFTTGQVALVCGVANRTASKWIDSGRLPGYRIPGSEDRRVTRAVLLAFLRQHGMPLGELEEVPVLLVGVDDALAARLAALGVVAERVPDAFTAGVVVGTRRPSVAVIDAGLGRREALNVGRRLREVAPSVRLIGLVSEDDDAPLAWGEVGYAAVYQQPVDPALLAEAVTGKGGCEV